MSECIHKWDAGTCMFCKLEGERDAARAEVERLRREYDVRAVIERCPQHDAPTLVDGYQKGRVRIVCSECCDEDNERLREALRRIMGLDGCDETFCLDQKCGTCDECFARAALTGAPSETRREQDRALAERVLKAVLDTPHFRQFPQSHETDAVRALDLDALLFNKEKDNDKEDK